MPQVASLYALPLAWEKEHNVRRSQNSFYDFYDCDCYCIMGAVVGALLIFKNHPIPNENLISLVLV